MKGISAVIATVLLVAFTVAVAGILSVWSTTLTTTQTQTVSNQTGGQALCSPALILDEAKINTTHAIVTYHNAGNQIITNVKVWVRNSTTINSTDVSTLTAGEADAVVVIINNTQDLVRVTGTCASNVQVSAECKSSDKCWKV